MRRLESMGTAQNRKVYSRHGVGEPMYGVSYANLGQLRREIKIDQALAERLWASGNHDARVLATMIADPTAVADRTLEAWSRQLDNYVITGALSDLVARTPRARQEALSLPDREGSRAGVNPC
jgi:3-methyladenine DNA glycosylase AlkD